MAGQGVAEREHRALLADCSERFGARETARRLGVSHVAILRYREGQRRLPSALVPVLSRLARETPLTSAEQLFAEISAKPGSLSPGAVRARGTISGQALDELLCSGVVVIGMVDCVEGLLRPRRYRRPRLYSPNAAPPAPTERGPIDAGWMRSRLTELGRSPKWLASQLQLRPSTIRGLLTGHIAVPAARQEDLIRVLEPDVTGEEIRSARQAAGWTLAHFGRRAGVHPGLVSAWESGRIRVLAKYMPAVRRAVAEGRHAAETDQRREEAVGVVVDWVREHPSCSSRALRKHYSYGRWTAALAEAFGRGLVVERVSLGLGGRQRRVCYVQGAAPVEPCMLGGELRRQREAHGLGRAELAPFVGVVPGTLRAWEFREDQPVPVWSVSGLQRGLEQAQPSRLRLPVEARGRILAALGDGELSRTLLLSHAGRSRVVLDELDRMFAEGLVVRRRAWDRLGRPVEVLARAVEQPTGMEERNTMQVVGRREQAAALIVQWVQEHPATSAAAVRHRYRKSPWREALGDVLGQGRVVEQLASAPGEKGRWYTTLRCYPPGSAPRDPMVAEIEHLLAMLAERPGGLMPCELPDRVRADLSTVDRAIEAGEAHWSEVIRSRKDGRLYRRRVLVAGPPPDDAAPAAQLSGRQLEALMATAGWNLSTLSRHLEVSRTTLRRWRADGVPAVRVPTVLEAV